MAKKPTYEQLEQRVKELEREASERERSQEELRASHQRFKEMAELLPTIIGELDRDLTVTYVNQAGFETFGYTQDDLEAGLNAIDMLHPDDRNRGIRNLKKAMRGTSLDGTEYRMVRKDGSELTALIHSRPIYEGRKVVGIRTTVTDITTRKRAEEALRERERELEITTTSLKEVNTALRVLLDRRDEDRRELEAKVVANVRELVVPFVERVKMGKLDPGQAAYLRVIESNLTNIISPFLRTLSAQYHEFTPTEIHIANLIREGTKNKDIAKLMGLSIRTIEFHRENVRKKLDLKNRKANLRTHLLSLR